MTQMHGASYYSVRNSHSYGDPYGDEHTDNPNDTQSSADSNRAVSFASPLSSVLSPACASSAGNVNYLQQNGNQAKRLKHEVQKHHHPENSLALKNEFDEIDEATQCMREFKHFLLAAPIQFSEDDIIRQFRLPNDEQISCVRWKGVFCVTGTDIVRSMVYRFTAIGRDVTNRKKFEEGIFSDLRNLKINVDATLESPKSELLEFLYKRHCVRTKKKQKVFFWYSVHHDQLFIDALERELKKEAATNATEKLKGNNGRLSGDANDSTTSPVLSPPNLGAASTVATRNPALLFKYESSISLIEQLPQILENLPPKYAELLRETTTGSFSNYGHQIAPMFPTYNFPESIPIPLRNSQGSYSDYPRKLSQGSNHDQDHGSNRHLIGYQKESQSNDDFSHSVSRNSFSQSLTPVSLETTPPLHGNSSSSSVEYPITPLQTTRKNIASLSYAGQWGEDVSENRQLSTPQSVTAHSHHKSGYLKPMTQESLWNYTLNKQNPNHVLKTSDAAENDHKLPVPRDADLYAPNDTDFPLDVLTKEDYQRTSLLDSSHTYKEKYTDFVHHHRPALSFSSLWGGNYIDDTTPNLPPQFQADLTKKRNHRHLYEYIQPPQPQSPDWNQFLFPDDWSKQELRTTEQSSASQASYYNKHYQNLQPQYSQQTKQNLQASSPATYPATAHQLGSPLSFSNTKQDMDLYDQHPAPYNSHNLSEGISPTFVRSKKVQGQPYCHPN